MLRRWLRPLPVGSIFVLSLLSCGREVTGPGDGRSYGWARFAALALDPQLPLVPGTANAASDVAPFTRVRVTLRHLDGSAAKDTVVEFPSTSDSVALSLSFPLPLVTPDTGLSLALAMAYVNAAGDTVFRGGPLNVTARRAGAPGTSLPVQIPITYSGPGANAASVALSPDTGTVLAGTTTLLTAVARDGQLNVIPNTPVFFSSTDTSRASVPAPGSGMVTWRARRGPVRVVATLLNGPADTSLFQVTLPPSQLLLVSGDAQAATVGTALPAPVVLRVAASDSVGVQGTVVTFAVTTGGGTLSTASATSDANGLVSIGWTLGQLVGAQSITATATGVAGALRTLTATGLASQVGLNLGAVIGPAGTNADDADAAGNAVNLVGTAVNGAATTLAAGAGGLPTFDFNTAGGLDRTTGFERGDLLAVRADQKHDGAALILDSNNNNSFADELPQTGFGMHANRFITFDLAVIRTNASLPSGQAFQLTGIAGPANFAPTTGMSLAVLLDGVLLLMHDVATGALTSNSFSLSVSGAGRYLTFVALEGTGLEPNGDHGAFARVTLTP